MIEKEMRSENHIMPWGVYKNPSWQCTVQRRKFDNFLALKAVEAGAELMTLTKVCGIKAIAPGHVEVELVKYPAEKMRVLSGRGMIIADGPRTLANSIGLGYRFTDKTSALALAYELSWPDNSMDYYEIYYGVGIAQWGYTWVFPYRDVLNVGVGYVMSEVKKRNSLQSALIEFINNHPHASRLLRGKPVIRKQAGLIPLRTARNMVGNSTLVVGDAAGLVHPLVGSGIEPALDSGNLAGNVMSSALDRGDLSHEFLSRYQQEWRSTLIFRSMERQHFIAMAGQVLSRVDRNIIAKIVQFSMGRKLSLLDKSRVLTYPWLGQP